jgi:hypothetical protein
VPFRRTERGHGSVDSRAIDHHPAFMLTPLAATASCAMDLFRRDEDNRRNWNVF